MRRPSVIIYNSGTTPSYGIPYLYTNNTWKSPIPYIYHNNEWWLVDRDNTEYAYLVDPNGNYILDSNGKYILVRNS